MNPKSFVPILEKSMDRFKGNTLMYADKTAGVETQEGPFAYIEAIELLRGMKPIPPLVWSKQLARAAQDHVNDIGPQGIMGSLGSDGSLPTDRIARYAQIDETWGESCCFGTITANEVIETLIVNDGQ